MAGLISILIFILLMSWSACSLLETSNLSSLKEVVDVVLVRKNKTQYVRFGLSIPSRPVNQKYSPAFTIEPAEKDSVLRKAKVVASTKTRAEVRIILDIPGRIKVKKGELIPLSSAKKRRATEGRSTFQTIGRGNQGS